MHLRVPEGSIGRLPTDHIIFHVPGKARCECHMPLSNVSRGDKPEVSVPRQMPNSQQFDNL
jgi:hypothetical protein